MSKKMKKTVALLLTLIMLIGTMTACSGGGNTSGDTSGNASKPSSAAAEETGLFDENGKYKEPVTITQAIQADSAQKFGEGQSYDKNVWTDYIEETYNIKLEVAFSADSTSGAYGDKLRMVLSSGELPDLFTSYYDIYNDAQTSGMLADLTEAFDLYASDELKKIREDNPELFSSCTVDGKLYAIPQIGSAMELAASQLWIRQDWLKAVNMEAPANWEEFIELARAFKEKDPDGNGIDDTVGLGLIGGLKWGGVGFFEGIASAFHAYGNDTWIKNDDGEIVYGAIQPEMKTALSAAHDMFTEGLLDPEFGTKTTDSLIEDIYNNKVGMFFGADYCGYWPLQDLANQNPEAIFLPYSYVSADSEKPMVTAYWPVDQYTCVSADCANPEAAILIANLYLATNNENADAETIEKYDYSGDVSSYMLCPVRLANPGFEFRTYEAIKKAQAGDESALTSKMQVYYDNVKAYEEGDISMYGYWSQVGPEGSIKVIQDYIDNDQVYLTWMRGGAPTDFSAIAATLGDMETETFVKIITGALSIDEFDTFVENYKTGGGDDYTKAVNEMYGDK